MTSAHRKSTFCFLRDSAPLYMRRSELWPAAAIVNVQVIPVDSHDSGTVYRSVILLHWSIWAGLTTAIWITYWCKTHKHTHKRNPKTNDCNVESCVNRCHLYCEFCSIWFYVSNVRLYIRLWVVELNLYINSCVLKFYGFVFFVHEMFLVNVNLFFSEKGFFAETWTPQNKTLVY